MKALLMRLSAPMQAWGTQSRFSERDTQLEPSKSGVIGLLGAALGLPRTADFTDLAGLAMAVRVDREGRKMRDFHTVGGGTPPLEFCQRHGMKRARYGVSKANGDVPEPAISNRYYLADARFLVALGGSSPSDEALLQRLATALAAPVHPLFLGRKSFVPAEPVLHDPKQPLRSGDSLREILEREPWDAGDRLALSPRAWSKHPERLRLVLESPSLDEGAPRADVPVSFEKGRRRFITRHVVVCFIPTPISATHEENAA